MNSRNIFLILFFMIIGLSALACAEATNGVSSVYEGNGVYVEAKNLSVSGLSKFLFAGVFNPRIGSYMQAGGYKLKLVDVKQGANGLTASFKLYLGSREISSENLGQSDVFSFVDPKKNTVLVKVKTLSLEKPQQNVVLVGWLSYLKKGNAVAINNARISLSNLVANNEGQLISYFYVVRKNKVIDEFSITDSVISSQSSSCVKDGESLGAVEPNNNAVCCPGLVNVVSPENMLGSRGTCENPTRENLFAKGNKIWLGEICLTPQKIVSSTASINALVECSPVAEPAPTPVPTLIPIPTPSITPIPTITANSTISSTASTESLYISGTMYGLDSVAADGSLSYIGANNIAKIDVAVRSDLSKYNVFSDYSLTGYASGVKRTASVFAYDASGNVYAGGYGFVVKLDGKNWVSLGGAFDYQVSALAFDRSGNLYAGGSFTKAGNCTTGCSGVAKWDGTAWSALGNGLSAVNVLVIDAFDNVYAGGYFSFYSKYDNSNVVNIAKFDPGTSTWRSVGNGTNCYSETNWVQPACGTDGLVNTLVFDAAGNLYAGGSFTKAGNCASGCSGVAKWDGTAWSALGKGISWSTLKNNANTVVYSLFVDGNNIYAGGQFAQDTSCSHYYGCKNIAVWDTVKNQWSVFATTNNVYSEYLSSMNFYTITKFGGEIYLLGGKSSNGGSVLLKFNKDTKALSMVVQSQKNLPGFIKAILPVKAFYAPQTIPPLVIPSPTGSLYVGGDLTGKIYSVNAAGESTLVKDANGYISRSGNNDTWSGSGIRGIINVFTYDASGNLYAGGEFKVYHSNGSIIGRNIAKLDGKNWVSLGGAFDYQVSALAFDSSGNLYAGGSFTKAGNCASGCRGIAKWDGANWVSLGNALLGSGTDFVRALVVDAYDNVYVGGRFNFYSKEDKCSVSNIVKYNPRTSTWSGLGNGTNGYFVPNTIQPVCGTEKGNTQTGDFVNALALDSSGILYAGGAFSYIGNCISGCNKIAKWDGTAWSDVGNGLYKHTYSNSDFVTALFVDGNKIYVGGSFSRVGDCNSNNGCVNIAVWDSISGKWSAVASNFRLGKVNAITKFNGELYAGTYDVRNSRVNSLVKLNSSSSNWSTILASDPWVKDNYQYQNSINALSPGK